MDRLRGLLLDAGSVVIGGLRLVWRHWPALLTTFLFGAAAHGGLIWAAVALSNSQPFVAGLILPLAPVASMGALILMLRQLAPSLRHASFTGQTVQQDQAAQGRVIGKAGAQLSLVASMLVPFLALYSAQGYLEEDRKVFVNAAGTEELLGNAGLFYGESADLTRIFMVTGIAAVGILVAATFAFRRFANHFNLATRHVTLALVVGYVEVFWMFSVASMFDELKAGFRSWFDNRVAVAWATEQFDSFVSWLGVFGRPVRAAADLIGSIFSSSANIVLIPLSWLVVGAIAYGRRIQAPPQAAMPGQVPPLQAPKPVIARIARVRARAEKMPSPVRRVGREFSSDLRERFSKLGDGLRMLAVAGLAPMLLFCLVFFLARYAEYYTAEGLRLLIGPQDLDTGLATSAYVDVAGQAVYSVLLIALVAAAVDRIILRIEKPATEPAATETPGAAAPSSEVPTAPIAIPAFSQAPAAPHSPAAPTTPAPAPGWHPQQ